MRFDDATLAQNRASEPLASTWLSANAGSGKTKVLTDRVARLLLRGVAPQRILCLTYTKAAASEMQNRLFKLLGEWAMLPDAKLRDALAQIDEAPQGADALANARRLFARAIEAPGGLKIQTIHSFCAALLRRFPLEAELSPAFQEMDDRAAHSLRGEILDQIAEGPERGALEGLARVFTGSDLDDLLREIVSNQGFDGPEPDLCAAFDLPAGFTGDALLAEVLQGGENELIDQVLTYLDAGSTNDVKAAAKLRDITLDTPDLDALEQLEGVFLKGKGAQEPFTANFDRFPTKATRTAMAGAILDQLFDFMRRVEVARPRRLALQSLIRAQALHAFARVFRPAYGRAKAARGWLDFDDLILHTVKVLTDPLVAQWVLFKLDGGVDHILVDEAQDTSPTQWRVIELLTQEFTAGHGARDASRTLFVVGDKKQSIYSFQGADLQVFDQMQAQFRQRLADVDVHLNEAALEHSFRSSDAILRAVDAVFRPPREVGLGGVPVHIAFQPELPGRVDIWPVEAPGEKREEEAWFNPVDLMSAEHHHRRLARKIAAELRRMIDARTPITHKGKIRAMHEGDVLILVRRRNALFHEIINACKAEGLEIAGADRLRLGAELAVRDLTALLNVLATPEDDLSLAACLRSPLFGWSEQAIFDLAHGRGKAFLWARLRMLEDNAALSVLNDLRMQADFLRPYDLLERMLTRHDGRRRLLKRLGAEAEDGIDALLAQAMAYERLETPSLTGFLAWLEHGDVQIKRELDSAGNRLRVMTVHGAKGLEAPIVVLPDTADRKLQDRGQIVPMGDTVAWRGASGRMPEPLQAEVDARAELSAQEDARLLYVAMTRAESWLIVAASGEVKSDACWYNQIAVALQHLGAEQQDMAGGVGQRFSHGVWPEQAEDVSAPPHAGQSDLPAWVWQPAPTATARATWLSPSSLGGAKVLAGEEGHNLDDALARGTQLHLLLEHLPSWPRSTWDRRGADLLAIAEAGLPPDFKALMSEACAVLDAPDLAPVFGPDSLAEVEITAQLGDRTLYGVIDRLIMFDDHVLAVDFKSNRNVPDCPASVPEGLLRQMGAYRAALKQVFEAREIRVALLWSAQAQLMNLPADLVDAALARAALE